MRNCQDCEGKVVVFEGEYVCEDCGLVDSNMIVDSSYVINLQLEKGLYRQSTSLGDRINIVDGIGSYIDYPHAPYFLDAGQKPLSPQRQQLFKRLKNTYSMAARIRKKESNYKALRLLNRVAAMLELPDHVRNRAAYFYRKISKSGKKEIYSNHYVLIGVCMLLAVRENKIPVPLKEITEILRTFGRRINKRNLINAAHKIKIEFGVSYRSVKSENYLARLVSDIVADPNVHARLEKQQLNPTEYAKTLLKESKILLEKTTDHQRGGRNPYVFAVSTIYAAEREMAKKEKRRTIITQQILGAITDVADYSIRDHFNAVLKKKSLEPSIDVP